MKPTDIPFGAKKIAVIGGGISGMGAAYALAKTHDVTLFESEKRLGGHARTVLAGRDGNQPVDTGFIVFNEVNYPNMVRLFDDLDVPVKNSNMNFGVSIGDGAIEYALRSLPALIAQKRNLVRPAFLRMVRDILHFNRHAFDLAAGSDMTIGQLLETLGTGAWFRDYYLLPLSGAIWSTPKLGILDYPADSMLRFFKNHALLSTNNHQWKTVDGGSIEYVKRLEWAMRQRGVKMRLGEDVQGVRRSFLGNAVKTLGSDWMQFDEVVFATHADDTLRLLIDPSDDEKANLGAVRYQPNHATLHADIGVMPKRSACWSSWVYTERSGAAQRGISLSYWMNSLQGIPLDDPLFVTLNDAGQIDERLIYDQATFRHPVYDAAALQAQAKIKGFNGHHNRWYCGAWMANGFHEDGLASGLA
ncbi:MAG: FAD-dependent oxidoreductase, partial [Deltaproteobacteria bacterium]